MVAEKRSHTTADAYIFSVRVTHSGRHEKTVTVVFLPVAVSGAALSNHLRDFLFTNPLSAELWLVAPDFVGDGLLSIYADNAFQERVNQSTALDAIRLIVVDRAGSWSELSTSQAPPQALDASVRDNVLAAGLRIMFREGGGLAQAPAGLHYKKPGGKHSEYFLRTGAVVARSPLAYFVAVALLPLTSHRSYSRIWVDTNAIASVAYALCTLLGIFDDEPRLTPVDSFGGHERLSESAPTPADQPLVLISASTSGGLAAKVRDNSGVEGSDIITLFSVGPAPGTPILCDLTRQSPDDTDEHRFDAFPSWKSTDCPLCTQGRSLIRLHGEEFAPETARASERTLKAVHSNRALRGFMKEFVGTGVIRVGRRTPTTQGDARTVSFELESQLKNPDSPIQRRVVRELQRRVSARTRSIVSLGDADSDAVAELARQVAVDAGLSGVAVLPKSQLTEADLSNGHVLVVAGTVGTGRELLNISRLLRPAEVEMIHYFVVCGRPRSKAVWSSLESDLRFSGKANFYPMHTIWQVDCEPDSHRPDPWLLELDTLRYVAGNLPESVSEAAKAAVVARIDELTEEDPDTDIVLFPASDYGARGSVLRLNPNFAFWDQGTLRDVPATEDEVYFTISTVMHHFRYSAEGQYALFGVPGHGYVLNPLNFGRFNDPVIQASILRSAQGTELDYRNHRETSRHMADEMLHLLEGYNDVGFGGAVTEFSLSLARGLAIPDSAGALRLHAEDRARVGERGASVNATDYPFLSALMAFIATADEPK